MHMNSTVSKIISGSALIDRNHVAQLAKHWPAKPVSWVWVSLKAKFFLSINGVPSQTAFCDHSTIISIWLKYCWKWHKFSIIQISWARGIWHPKTWKIQAIIPFRGFPRTHIFCGWTSVKSPKMSVSSCEVATCWSHFDRTKQTPFIGTDNLWIILKNKPFKGEGFMSNFSGSMWAIVICHHLSVSVVVLHSQFQMISSEWMILRFKSLSTVFQLFWYDGRMMMKGFVQLNLKRRAIYG